MPQAFHIGVVVVCAVGIATFAGATAPTVTNQPPHPADFVRFWYYQSPFPPSLFTVDPKEVVLNDDTEFTFRGYRVREGTPVVFIRQPEPGVRNYNICAELLPNEQWALGGMHRISHMHTISTAISNATQHFRTVVNGYEHSQLAVDADDLLSGHQDQWRVGEDVPYFVCVRPDGNGWNALEELVLVRQENATLPYYGYQSCQQLLDAHPELCGCYYVAGSPGGAGWVNVPTQTAVSTLAATDTPVRFRSGCCTRLMPGSAALEKRYPIPAKETETGPVGRHWGTCAPEEDVFEPREAY